MLFLLAHVFSNFFSSSFPSSGAVTPLTNLLFSHFTGAYISSKHGIYEFPSKQEDFLPIDFNSTGKAMEDCQRLGLRKSIGVIKLSYEKLTGN
ncbi:hypothetical protein GQ457_13G012190 [Hibiscus cannabinus]